jgi:hypothetical protein
MHVVSHNKMPTFSLALTVVLKGRQGSKKEHVKRKREREREREREEGREREKTKRNGIKAQLCRCIVIRSHYARTARVIEGLDSSDIFCNSDYKHLLA